MELVLGVSMTATTIRTALVEGEKADGVIVDHDVFDITAVDGSATPVRPMKSSPRSSELRKAQSTPAIIWRRSA